MAAQRGGAPSADAVRTVVGPVVDDAGLYLEDVAVSGSGGLPVVRITVDLPEDAVGSLDSDTLGDVSRALSAALDADDVVPGAYTLEISTPGTSRPLTELRHFRRARTRLVTLRLLDGGTAHGRLVDVLTDGQDDPALLLDDGTRVPFRDVRKGKVEVELTRVEEGEHDEGEHDEGEHGEREDDEGAGTARTDEEA